MGDEDQAFRKIQLKVEDIQGRNCLTQFDGMTLTTDKLKSMLRKWQTLIEAFADAKTTQIRQIRKKMVEIMQREASSCELKEFVNKIIPEVIGKEITKATQGIYPLQNVYLRKVKVLKAPKFDLMKLMEVHGDYFEVEAAVARADSDMEEDEGEEA